MKKKVKVGLDFDGVVAYNPFRVIRAPVTFFKRKILKKRGTRFFVPVLPWQRFLWRILHESSVFPALGIKQLKIMASEPQYEFHLITARYSFLRGDLDRWLLKNKLTDVFMTINSNELDEQPHLFKEKVIKKLNLDYFVEDNLDIVAHLRLKSQTSILWIYNVLDRVLYPRDVNSYPSLKMALARIVKDLK